MKKIFTLSMIAALAIAGVAEAKGLKMGRSSGMSRSVTSAPATTSNSANTNVYGQSVGRPATATSTTPAASAPTASSTSANTAAASAAQPARSGGIGMGGVVAGAAAGYLLGGALSPNVAQAQTEGVPAQVAANTAQAGAVPEFKSLNPQDPYLIEQTISYRRWCLNGVQYISGVNSSQFTPLINPNGTPMLCRVVM